MSEKFNSIRRSVVSEQVATRLIELIQEGELQPGEKLPSERELAARLEVSRPSLREALRALSMMNIIEIRPGDGTYITSLEPELLIRPLEFILSLQDDTLLFLFEARRIIEVGCAGLAAQRISDDELDRAEELVERAREVVDDPIEFLKTDLELHDIIVEATRNPLLQQLMASISQLQLASRERTVTVSGMRDRTIEDHAAIVKALRGRNPKASERAMLQHLTHAEQALLASQDTTDEESAA